MTGKQMAMVIGAILAAGAMAAFGPGLLEDNRQAKRDESHDCNMYRASVAIDNLAALQGRRPDRAETERQRKAAGCTPVN